VRTATAAHPNAPAAANARRSAAIPAPPPGSLPPIARAQRVRTLTTDVYGLRSDIDSANVRLVPTKGMRAPTSPRATRAFAAAAIALAAVCVPRVAHAQCVDDELKNELIGGRHYRGVEDRLFTKAFRHEISVMGGYYAADLYSSNWLASGAYTFHFSEDLALEASFAYTRFRSAVTDTYEARYPEVQITQSTNNPGKLYFGHIVWSFAYGKVRWMGGGISRFDFNLALGAGVTDDSTALGVTGSAGLGAKLYFGKWFALRWDVRDHLLREALLGDEHLVNDILVTVGASMFIPFGG
jgi:outer membrane beta-barrel protein